MKKEDILQILKELAEATANMEEQARILTVELNNAYCNGITAGLQLGRVQSSPNSFAASCDNNVGADNSDDLYVN